jgi:hypothetical protein
MATGDVPRMVMGNVSRMATGDMPRCVGAALAAARHRSRDGID